MGSSTSSNYSHSFQTQGCAYTNQQIGNQKWVIQNI
jgi:hypothetical protein